ncbi:hypothetical protein D8674_004049 [Pyrus ussuriensis x Pyrus communis]|uniref:Uncharacterized protein n=1 Tax=Pyrus ussuriensis x Pyrus communis TaxID=2448454 RepID=A0A5N5FXM7_9ROSA|nr:hypothetical protein D8674_004049 [Pyrus ussuriensis x Pyrus communis]
MNLGATMNNIASNLLKPLKKALSIQTAGTLNVFYPAQQNQIDNDKIDQPDDVVPPVAAEGALGQSSSSQSHGTNTGNVAEGSIGYDSVDSTVEVEKP